MSKDNGTAREVKARKGWRPTQVAEAQVPIMRALGVVLGDSFPDPGVIIKALNRNGERLTTGLRRVIGEIINIDRPDVFQELTEEKYQIIKDDADFDDRLKISSLKLVPVLERGENSITGAVLRERAEKFPQFGRHAGQYFLNNWWELPEEIRTLNVPKIVLPGSVYMRKEDGRLFCEAIIRGEKGKLTPNVVLFDSECIGDRHYFLIFKK